MASGVHRNGDLRACGAVTIVTNQTSVYANGQLIASDGDPNSHVFGNIVASTNNVYIGGILVSNNGDAALADGLCPSLGGLHCFPSTTQGSDDVFVGD